MSSESEEATGLEGLLMKMTGDSVAAAGLDDKMLMMVRIAALVAVDAPPASYLMNLATAAEIGLQDDDVRSVIIAVAPIVGTSRAVTAVSKIADALGFAMAEFGG